MRILLVQPAPFEHGRLGLENMIWLCEPVALTAIAGAVPEHEVRILDMRVEEPRALAETLRDWRPDVVGTTSMTTDCYQAKSILYAAKKWNPEVRTVVGGHHPTLEPDEFKEEFVDVIARGEGELTFAELITAWSRGAQDLSAIDGLVWRRGDRWQETKRRSQVTKLDALPRPASHLIQRYRPHYFFFAAQPMASLFTSRGCSYDCNFCAIWEFYERKTRYLSASAIADQLEQITEPFVFFLDDNFLSNRTRLEELIREIKTRGIKKWWFTQGRSDFVAEHPELMAQLVEVGLTGLLSGYETNDEKGMEELRKRNRVEKNQKAAAILRDLGVWTTGIFMVRPDFDENDFRAFYAGVNEIGASAPLVTILTPLPGTELYRKLGDKLLTRDRRLFDLLHPVLPTKLSREEFYRWFVEKDRATQPAAAKGRSFSVLWKQRAFWAACAPNLPRFFWRRMQYKKSHYDVLTYLRGEAGMLRAPTRPSLAVGASRYLEVA